MVELPEKITVAGNEFFLQERHSDSGELKDWNLYSYTNEKLSFPIPLVLIDYGEEGKFYEYLSAAYLSDEDARTDILYRIEHADLSKNYALI